MKGLFFTTVLLIILMPLNASAFEMDVVKEPVCFVVKNEANFSVTGSIVTDYYMRPDGAKSRHRSNFRMGPPGTKDDKGYPDDIAEFCTHGPFYPDRKIEFVLKTLFPVFSCMTRIDQGPIVIKGHRNEDDTGNVMWAECFE